LASFMASTTAAAVAIPAPTGPFAPAVFELTGVDTLGVAVYAGDEARTWTGGEVGLSGMIRFEGPADFGAMGVDGAELGTTEAGSSLSPVETGPSFGSPGAPGLR